MKQPCIDAHLDYYNNIDIDIAKLMCDGYFDYPNPAKAAKEPKNWYETPSDLKVLEHANKFSDFA